MHAAAVDRMLDEFTRLPMRATFRFDVAQPSVVTVEFATERGRALVRRRIGRELLHGRLTRSRGPPGTDPSGNSATAGRWVVSLSTTSTVYRGVTDVVGEDDISG
ncbi:hypothetical protein Sros01_43840 [Streptomyces roseochromogenus]|nr:hypothetical protein Sros01_43840 [Streptomyces roseochromogenus]